MRWLLGCLLPPVNGLLVGFVTWRIVDAATPCRCDGEPDAEFYNSMQSVPYGIAAAVLTAAITAVILVFLMRRRNAF